jgi:hypothetical protein
MVGLGAFYVSRNTWPDGRGIMPWIATPITFGAVMTVLYLGWCAMWHLISRLLRVVPTSGRVRLFSNVSFAVMMLALIFIPFEPITFTIQMPTKHRAQSSISE